MSSFLKYFLPFFRPRGFQTPGVPLVPILGILINVYLMLRLSNLTLIRFSIWMLIGKENFQLESAGLKLASY